MNGFTGLNGSKTTFFTPNSGLSNFISKLLAACSEVFFMSVLVFKMFLKYFLGHTARYLGYSTLVCGAKGFSELPVPITKSPTACKDDLMLR